MKNRSAHRLLALVLAMIMLMTGTVFAEDPAISDGHDHAHETTLPQTTVEVTLAPEDPTAEPVP